MAWVVGFSLFFLVMIVLVAYLLIKAHLRWRAHPTMEQYLSEHPRVQDTKRSQVRQVRCWEHKELGCGERL